MKKEKQLNVRYTIRPLPVKVCSRERLASDLVYGRLALKDVPKKLRLRHKIFYTYALKYYNYRQNIDNPFTVFFNDIRSLPEGGLKDDLKGMFHIYGQDLGITYEQYEECEERRLLK